MRAMRVFALAAVSWLTLSWASAQAGVFIGVGIPGPCYRPYYHHYWYGPRGVIAAPPVVVAPPPPVVVAAPAPVYVQQAPQVIRVPVTQTATPQTSTLPAAPVPVTNN